MDREVLPSRLVQDAIKTFVPVRLNAWKEPEICERYRVVATPSFAVLDPTGKLVLRTDGYLAPADFVSFLQAGKAAIKTAS